MLKRIIKKIIPTKVIQMYHFMLSLVASLMYGRPSQYMHVIGITGTTGKSTTVEFLSAILEEAGYTVGVASTIKFKVAKKEWLNDKKMTMIGRFQLQKLLKTMKTDKCDIAIVETTSEGIRQFRHKFIHYDTVVFTNLYPEHIDSHGSFENYKNEKLKLFRHLETLPHKTLNGEKILKVIVANADDEHVDEFLNFNVDEKLLFGIKNSGNWQLATNIASSEKGITFTVGSTLYNFNLLGEHNVYNALAAITVGGYLKVPSNIMQSALKKVVSIPGRLELINEEQPFTVIVDYAFEPRAMQKLYEAVASLKNGKVIQVLGTTGGGRDITRGAELGKMANDFVDSIIVTNEDPYDDDPDMLMERVISGIEQKEKVTKILDRKKAITYAIKNAQSGDIVLITGKGSEQGIVGKNGTITPWDDRKVARTAILDNNQ